MVVVPAIKDDIMLTSFLEREEIKSLSFCSDHYKVIGV